MDVNRHIVLIGMMGTGKTTVGRLLANRLGRRFWDNDQALSRTVGGHGRGGATALPSLPADTAAALLGVGAQRALLSAGLADVIVDPAANSTTTRDRVIVAL